MSKITYNEMKDLILSDQNILLIIKEINKQTKIPITEDLTDKFFILTKKINLNKIVLVYKKDLKKINELLVNLFIQRYKSDDNFNIEQYLYEQIRKNTTHMMDQDTNNFNRLRYNNDPNLTVRKEGFENVIPISKINYNHIEYNTITLSIDTRYQNLVNQDSTIFSFHVTNNTKTKHIRSGNITAVGNITNIVNFEISKFSIPYTPYADNSFNQITLRMNNFYADIIECYEFPHHWKFTTYHNEKNNRIELTPIDKIYEFRKPITAISNFDLTFGNPFNPIKFDKDRLITQFLDYTSNPAIFTFNESHNLKTDDTVIITGFTTNDMAKDYEIIEQINNPEGYKITTPTCSSICVQNLDLTKVKEPIEDLKVEIYFNSKRISCHIKVKYIINDSL